MAVKPYPQKGNKIRLSTPEGGVFEGTVTYTGPGGETELSVELDDGDIWEPTFFLSDEGYDWQPA
jgi:hypothetical protein